MTAMAEAIAEARAGTNGRQPLFANTAFELPLERIDAADDNPRREVGDVTELAASIAAIGLLQPLVVVERGTRYLVVAGARRLAAAQFAGLTHVPAIVRDLTETERQEAMLIENLQRVDLTPIEEATSYKRLVDLGHTQRDLASRVGRSQSHVSKRLALLELPKAVLKEVDSGGITLDDAQQLGKLTEHPQRLAEAFKRRHEYGGVERQVREQLGEVKLAAKVERHREKLEKSGIRIVEMKRRHSYTPAELPNGMAVVSANAYGGVHLDHKKHAELDKGCHAAAIDPRTGDIIYVCTKPANHGRKKPAPTKAEREYAAQRERVLAVERQLKDEVGPARETFLVKLASKKVSRGELLALVAPTMIEHLLAWDTEPIAGKMLGLEPVVDNSGHRPRDRYAPAMYALAAESEAGAARVAFAIALAASNEGLGHHQWDRWGERQAEFLALLERHGYEISDTERAKLNEGKERQS